MKAITKSVWMRFLNVIAWRLRFTARLRRLRRRALVTRRYSPGLLTFEDRVVPVTNIWTGASGDLLWATTGNWSLGHVPVATEDVDIPDVGAVGPDITIVVNNAPVNSLSTRENLIVQGFGSTLSIRENLAINGGATLTMSTGLTAGTFLDFNSSSASTNQQVTTDGNGKIFLSSTYVRQSGVGHTVTFAPAMTVRATGTGSTGHLGSLNGGVAGTWVNQGTWSANGGVLNLVAGTFTNEVGGVWSTDAGTLTTGGTWDNNGTLSVNGGSLNLGGNFTGEGLGTLLRTGGSVNIPGTIDNTAQTLTLPGPGAYSLTGTITGGTIDLTNGAVLQINTGTIIGSTLRTSGGAKFIVDGDAFLSGITLDGRIDIIPSNPNFTTAFISNGLAMLAGSIINVNTNVNINGALEFIRQAGGPAAQTVTGTGTINLNHGNNSSHGARLNVTAAGTGVTQTVTLEPGITVNSSGGSVASGQIGIGGQFNGANELIVQGTMNLNSSAITLQANLAVGSKLVIPGTLNVLGGTVEVIVPTQLTGVVNISGGAFRVRREWDNQLGTVNLSGGSMQFLTTVSTADLGTCNQTGGAVYVTGGGVLDNRGASLTLGGTGQIQTLVVLLGGTLRGGTVTTTNGAYFGIAGGTLDGDVTGLTVNGTITLDSSGVLGAAGLILANNLVLNGTLNQSAGDRIDFSSSTGATQSITTTSTAEFVLTGGLVAGNLYGGTAQTGTSHTVAFGPNVTVRGRGTIGRTGSGLVAGTWTTQGTWAAEGGTLTFGSGTFSNQTSGLWEVSTGGTFTTAGTWTNTGTIAVTVGTLNLGGTGTLSPTGTFTTTGGTVNVAGTDEHRQHSSPADVEPDRRDNRRRTIDTPGAP